MCLDSGRRIEENRMKRILSLLLALALTLGLTACGDSSAKWQEQYDLGQKYLADGNYEEAILAFTAAIEIDPKRAPAYVGRGDAYLGRGSDEESLTAAFADFETALSLDDTNAGAYLGLAEVYIARDQFDEAMDILRRGVEKTGDQRLSDRLAELDLSKIENYANINDSFKSLAYDPENKYSVPYMWGTLGILYNTSMVNETVDSWNILWNEAYKGQIIMYDSSRDSMAVALRKLGYSVNTKNDSEIQAAADALTAQKPLVKAYMTDAIKQAMIGGSGALAVVYSGDAMLCMEENEDLAYAVPKEGSNMWFDSLVVTKDCQNMDAAYRFINFMCDPDVAAKNSAYIGYSTPNKAALEKMDAEMKNDPAYNPSSEVIAKCEVYLDLGDKTDLYNQLWEKVKLN